MTRDGSFSEKFWTIFQISIAIFPVLWYNKAVNI